MADLEYVGWGRFQDTGAAYRKWKFRDDLPELEAKKGWTLVDTGPSEEPRFRVWDTAKKIWSSNWDSADVYACTKNLKGFRWQPPREGETAIAEGLSKLASELANVVRSMNRRNIDSRKLDVIRSVVAGATGKKPESRATENRYVRLKFEGQYNNGDPYKDFELLVDAPEIPATKSAVQPRHAIKGDVLRECDDDESTPFALRRDGKRIGDPEWWRIRHLFVGLGQDDRPGLEEVGVLGALRALIPEGPCKEESGSLLWYDAFYATKVIDGTPIREGDFLLYAKYSGRFRGEELSAIRGSVVRVSRSLFPEIARQVESLAFIESSSESGGEWCRDRFRKYLGNSAALRAADATSPVLIVRPLRSPIGELIHASSDDSALFELIYSTGGRMPGEVAR